MEKEGGQVLGTGTETLGSMASKDEHTNDIFEEKPWRSGGNLCRCLGEECSGWREQRVRGLRLICRPLLIG